MSDRDPPTPPPPAPLLGCDDDGLDDLLRQVAEDPPPVGDDGQPVPATKPTETMADVIARMQARGFEFPHRDTLEPFMTSGSALTDAELMARLRVLQQTMVGSSPDPRDYITTRDEACAFNVLLNQRKTIAPAFRPFKRAAKPNSKNRFFTDRYVIGDRVVIDLHWLWVTRMNVPTSEARHLFETADFSFAEASIFARARMKGEDKAMAAGVSEVARILTTSFRSAPVRERLRTIDDRLKSLRQALLDRSHSGRHRLTPAAVESLHHAACALLIARGSATVASEILAHVGGSAIGPERMRDTKKRLVTFGMDAGSWGG